jgi:hypothetical protein
MLQVEIPEYAVILIFLLPIIFDPSTYKYPPVIEIDVDLLLLT